MLGGLIDRLRALSSSASSARDPRVIEQHESPARSLVSHAHGVPYRPLKTLADARSVPDGAVVLEGDWGGQIYVTCPIRLVECDERTLWTLLFDLDRIAWPGNGGDGSGLYYERHTVGSAVVGGMGGGIVEADAWIHEDFVEAGLSDAIKEVLHGRRDRIAAPTG